MSDGRSWTLTVHGPEGYVKLGPMDTRHAAGMIMDLMNHLPDYHDVQAEVEP